MTTPKILFNEMEYQQSDGYLKICLYLTPVACSAKSFSVNSNSD